MSALQAIVAGATYELTDAVESLGWEAEDGFGMPDVERYIQEGSLDGGIDFGYRLRPRRLAVRVAAIGVTGAGLDALRARLLGIFKPGVSPITLRRNYDDGAIRQIDVHYAGGMKLSTAERFANTQVVVIELVAQDPLWYDPAQRFVSFAISAGSSGFVIPSAVPTFIGSSSLEQGFALVYAGSWREYPTVEVVGPINNLVVTNQTTGEKLDFTGLNIPSGTTYYIDCRPRAKTVKDHNGADQIQYLTDDSDLATFHLSPDPESAGGANSIYVSGSAVTTATRVYIRYYDRFIGV